MSNVAIADIMRTAHVKRWGIVNTHRQQNVAEHSYLVIMLALEITGELFDFNEYPTMCFHVMTWAAWHDLPEVWLGDTPTPAKLLAATFSTGIQQQMEDTVAPGILKVRDAIPAVAQDIVKLADLVEARTFLQTEGYGWHASVVLDGIRGNVMTHLADCWAKYPKLPWAKVARILQDLA